MQPKVLIVSALLLLASTLSAMPTEDLEKCEAKIHLLCEPDWPSGTDPKRAHARYVDNLPLSALEIIPFSNSNNSYGKIVMKATVLNFLATCQTY